MKDVTIQFHEAHVSRDDVLHVPIEFGTNVQVLDALPVGNEVRYRYVTVTWPQSPQDPAPKRASSRESSRSAPRKPKRSVSGASGPESPERVSARDES